MIINHNMPAMNANRQLFGIGQSSQKTMEKLSSGLRINRAADDAAGLAISETMRNAIRSMNQASRNSQDAISLLQTAEGSLSQSQEILARMKELSIQAANDTYTANDRIELQKEVDALKGELNRVANSCNFNGKNLLDGSSSALASADKGSTHVLVRGSVRNADGTSAAGDYKITIDATVGQAQIMKSSIFKNIHEGDTVQHLGLDDNGITLVTATNIAQGDYRVTINTTMVASAQAVMSQFYASTGSAATSVIVAAVVASQNISAVFSVTHVSGLVVSGTCTYYAVSTDGSYQLSNGVQRSFTTAFVSSAGAASMQFNSLGGASNRIDLTTSGLNLKAGDKFTVNLRACQTVTGLNVQVKNSVAASQSINWSFNANSLNGNTTTWSLFSLETDGTVKAGTFGMEVGIASMQVNASGTTFTFDEGLGEVASLSTQLKDIDRFYDPNGRFMVDNPQVITLVEGDGKTTSFSIFGTDTLDQIKDKLNTAIYSGLEQSDLVTTAMKDNFVSYVTKADTVNVGSTQSMEGGFVIRSARAGQDGSINVIADEGIINALGLTTAQEAVDSGFTVTVADPLDPTKTVCQNLEISGNTLSSVIHPNIDVKFDSLADMTTAWNTTVKSFDITDNAATSYTTNIHIVDNTQVFQIGGTEGQSMGAAIGDMRLEALGIDNIQITDIDSASKAVAKLDTALSRISTQRATLGAVQNRLEYNITNLGVAGENLQASESRIRDADMAKEMMDFARINILSQSTMAMLAQANQQPQAVLQLLGR